MRFSFTWMFGEKKKKTILRIAGLYIEYYDTKKKKRWVERKAKNYISLVDFTLAAAATAAPSATSAPKPPFPGPGLLV